MYPPLTVGGRRKLGYLFVTCHGPYPVRTTLSLLVSGSVRNYKSRESPPYAIVVEFVRYKSVRPGPLHSCPACPPKGCGGNGQGSRLREVSTRHSRRGRETPLECRTDRDVSCSYYPSTSSFDVRDWLVITREQHTGLDISQKYSSLNTHETNGTVGVTVPTVCRW